MQFKKTMVAVALAAVASFASAATPTSLGSGAGEYSFTDNADGIFSLTLDAGSYSFTSTVSSVGFDLNGVWLTSSADPGVLKQYTKDNSTHFSILSQPVTISSKTTFFVDVDTQLGQYTAGNYAGSLWVSAVPEPASAALLLAGVGLFGLMGLRRRRH